MEKSFTCLGTLKLKPPLKSNLMFISFSAPFRYQIGQEYKAHHDYFDEQTAKRLGSPGNRIATALMYLSDVEEGGETYFPRATGGELKVPPRKARRQSVFLFTVYLLVFTGRCSFVFRFHTGERARSIVLTRRQTRYRGH